MKLNIIIIVSFHLVMLIKAKPTEKVTDISFEEQQLVEVEPISPEKLPPNPVNPGRASFYRYAPQVISDNLPPAQRIIYNLVNPKPIVDTIKESEKYGNDGEKLARIGRGFVGGIQSLGELFSSVVSNPSEPLKSLSRQTTQQLAALGSLISGL